MNVDLEKLTALCKRRGFVFQSCEIYGGTGSVWDYGPLGVELKANIKRLWWRDNVHLREDMVGLDAGILMHPKTWEASGHLELFVDRIRQCPMCNRMVRADHWESELKASRWFRSLREAIVRARSKKLSLKTALPKWVAGEGRGLAPNLPLLVLAGEIEEPLPEENGVDAFALALIGKAREGAVSPCPHCGAPLSAPRPFNLMFKTFMGPAEDQAHVIYLRPETAQGIFVNFPNVVNATRKKLPFGVAQIGKSFRNEVTPGNFIFRTREFEQMEIEYFVRPGTDDAHFESWVESRYQWYIRYGMRAENLRKRAHGKEELAHYSKATVDLEYLFPMGWSELEGIANRTDFDLKAHARVSGQALTWFDEETRQHITPYVIEPSAGADRAMLAFLVDAYAEETVKNEKRIVLRLHPELAPLKTAVLPLLRNRPEIVQRARELAANLRKDRPTAYDDTAGIGRLYRRQDEIGTPYCITVDVETVERDGKVTIRERDSMQQIRVPLDRAREVVRDLFDRGWAAVASETGLWSSTAS